MKKVSNDLISVVIPIYNVEKYLKRCIDSIIAQTYKNLEIILVDDGSPDTCPKICDDYAKKDERIIVIHKQNGGLSDARNYGIEAAKGHYISFVDSDDYVSKDYIKILYESLKAENSDMAIGGHVVLYPNGKKINKYTGDEYREGPETILKRILYDDGIDLSACSKLYKKELFKDIRFPVGRLYEDAATSFKLIDTANAISVASKPIYHYIIRENSISNDTFSNGKMDLIISTREMADYIKDKYPTLEKGCERRLMYAYLSTLTQLARDNKRHKNIEKKIISYINQNKKNILKDPNAPKRDKIGIISASFGFHFYKLAWKTYSIFRGEK